MRMKFYLALISAVQILGTNLCFSQTDHWMETDSIEFKQLYTLFPDGKFDSNSTFPGYQNFSNFKRDSLSEGIWKENLESSISGGLELDITSTNPFIKGSYRFILPEGEKGNPASGLAIGKINGNYTLIVLKYPNSTLNRMGGFCNIEFKCYSYDERIKPYGVGLPPYVRYWHILLGKKEDSDKRVFLSKGFLKLQRYEEK